MRSKKILQRGEAYLLRINKVYDKDLRTREKLENFLESKPIYFIILNISVHSSIITGIW